MRIRVCATAFLLSLCTAVVPRGHLMAQPQEKDAMTTSARQRFLEGVRQFDRGKYEEARVAFMQAYTLKRHPAVLLNLAQSELRSGHTIDAARHFSAFLREATSASANERADAEKALMQVRSKLGRVAVNVNTSGATIFLDGEAMGETPLPEPLDAGPGVHAIEARLGGRGVSTTVTVVVGKVATATLNLDAGAPPGSLGNEATPPGVATASSGTEVAEKPTEPPEPRPTPVPPKSEIAAPASEEETLGFFGWVKESPYAWISLGVAGAGLVTFAVGGILTITANNNIDSVSRQVEQIALSQIPPIKQAHLCTSKPVPTVLTSACVTYNDNVSIRDKDVAVTTVGGVVAGVGIAATIVGYFVSSPRKHAQARAAQPVLVPWVGPQTAGVGLHGSF